MTRIILIYGVLSGLVIILSMMLGILTSDGKGFFASEYFGYLIMVIAFSMIFVGVKRYRDVELGGVIKFLPALGTGLLIASLAGIIYVTVWEIYLFSTDYVFIHDYVAGAIKAKQEAGMTGAELENFIAEMDGIKDVYAKPYQRLPMTFLEIFPVGLIVAIVSAALLRNPKLLPARD